MHTEHQSDVYLAQCIHINTHMDVYESKIQSDILINQMWFNHVMSQTCTEIINEFSYKMQS